MSGADEILLGRQGGLATLTINRPRALNALTLDNYRRIDPAMRAWAADPSVRAVVVRGAGDRAFCAGGDVRAVYEAGRGIGGDPDLPAVFFREEYELIREIHRFPKPYLAIVDGITMGGGAGISVNGAYRVATERTLFAMPETGIGLFPDVGATRFLNRCPGHVGRYLGLTGARGNAADALYYGLDAALALEYRLTQHVMAGHDFYEGVRAMLIDRDRNPKWRPRTLAEVTDSMLDAYFAPIGDRELRFT